MVTCCDYIYIFMRGYLHHERHGTAKVLAQPELARTTIISNIFVLFYFLCFVLFFVFCFPFTVVCEQGLKLYTPQATLLTTSSLLRHEENLVP